MQDGNLAIDFKPMIEFVYVKNSYIQRRDLWDQIRNNFNEDEKGVVAGDFNCILEERERTCTTRYGKTLFRNLEVV